MDPCAKRNEQINLVWLLLIMCMMQQYLVYWKWSIDRLIDYYQHYLKHPTQQHSKVKLLLPVM